MGCGMALALEGPLLLHQPGMQDAAPAGAGMGGGSSPWSRGLQEGWGGKGRAWLVTVGMVEASPADAQLWEFLEGKFFCVPLPAYKGICATHKATELCLHLQTETASPLTSHPFVIPFLLLVASSRRSRLETLSPCSKTRYLLPWHLKSFSATWRAAGSWLAGEASDFLSYLLPRHPSIWFLPLPLSHVEGISLWGSSPLIKMCWRGFSKCWTDYFSPTSRG